MLDALIAGAGPAGALAARALARQGARVLLVDREPFPRHKLCGDTLNPGALRLLADAGLEGGATDTGLKIAGMRVSGPTATVTARYAGGRHGIAVQRATLDQWLLESAIAAGVRFEPGFTAVGALTMPESSAPVVRGLILRDPAGRHVRMPASVSIAADGRRSAVARSVGLGTAPAGPRRWAYGTYVPGETGAGECFGEMHVRPGWYAGVVDVPGGLTNLCVVVERPTPGSTPEALMREHLARDRTLARRFGGRAFAAPVSVLGPLAFDVSAAGVPGLLLAGDAAGFVDPMTGDGLNLAMRGGLLAAESASMALVQGGWNGVVERLTSERARWLGPKIRFNRWLRTLTASAWRLHAASAVAVVAPGAVRRLVAEAGDAA